MADFAQAFEKTIGNEGGYVNDPDDPGGETYKGVARKIHPEWPGWIIIDELKKIGSFPRKMVNPSEIEIDKQLQYEVRQFYLSEYWIQCKCNNIYNQQVAESIFDFAVNAGIATSIQLAQKVVGAPQDGLIGSQTTAAINNFNPDHFVAAFAIAKIRRYIQIITKRPTSRKYFEGWVIRAVSQS